VPGSAVRGGRGVDVAAQLSPRSEAIEAHDLKGILASDGAAVAIEALMAARFGVGGALRAGGATDLACHPAGGAGEEGTVSDGAVRLRQLFKLKCSGVAQRVAARLVVSPVSPCSGLVHMA